METIDNPRARSSLRGRQAVLMKRRRWIGPALRLAYSHSGEWWKRLSWSAREGCERLPRAQAIGTSITADLDMARGPRRRSRKAQYAADCERPTPASADLVHTADTAGHADRKLTRERRELSHVQPRGRWKRRAEIEDGFSC